METLDVLIVGAGAAGFSAAVYCSRAGLKTAVVGEPWKGPLAEAQMIGNVLGCDGVDGREFIERCLAQVKTYGCEVFEQEVVDLRPKDDGLGFNAKTNAGKEFEAKNIVIATGVSFVQSGVNRESELVGKGVHYCVACDGYFYKNKAVAVIGEGDFAAEEALELLALTKDITLFSNGREWQINAETRKKLVAAGIRFNNGKLYEFAGEKKLSALVMEEGKALQFDGAFVAMGTTNSTAFAYKLGLEMKEGFVVAERDGSTSVPGVYAAGACTGGYNQIAKSAGEGASAAISIIRKLTGKGWYVDQT